MQRNISFFILILAFFICPLSSIFAGEVELFIPEERAKQILLDEKEERDNMRAEKFSEFKRSTQALAIHENTSEEEVVSLGGAVIIEDGIEITRAELDKSDTNNAELSLRGGTSIHENTNTIVEVSTADIKRNDITIHENSVEFSNFIVHENIIKGRYSKEVSTAQVPNQKKVWTAAASQASLLFSTSAKERDRATKNLINNGGWLKVAGKLLESDDYKTRINGIQLLKAAVMHPKYRDVSTDVKIKKLSQLLISSLNDTDSKVRFIGAFILSKLTGDSFEYNYNSDPSTRQEAISAWSHHIETTYGS